MRGKVVYLVTNTLGIRITPAYAGKSPLEWRGLLSARDHPRLCGEKPPSYLLEHRQQGSPPPMRGKAFNFCHTVKKIGITPAYAGKSYLGRGVLRVRRDHPRLCGEKYGYYTIEVSSLGSPPPMRGKDGDSVHSRLPFRITPAYAGKSEQRLSSY